MRIIKLTMNAFSTYHQKTEINFDNMIDHGIYLISGPTGSGKTTIFDAMTFALYGSASGSERNPSYFRSDYALAKEETYVELTFEIHRKRYTVKRSPAYMREGYKTLKSANAYLTYDNQTIEGVKEVNQKLNQLLGVDVHQFKQIVMIAQGEFTKLIYANSEEREKVLRHIFHTESLVQLEDLLKEKTKSYKEQYMQSYTQLTSQFQLLSLSKDFMNQYQQGFHPSYIEAALVENQKLDEESQQVSLQYTTMKKNYNQLSQDYYRKQKINQDILAYQKVQSDYQKHLLQKETMNQCQKEIVKLKDIQNHQTVIYRYQNLSQQQKEHQRQLQKALEEEKLLQKQFHEIDTKYQLLSQDYSQKEQILLDIHQCKQEIQKQKDYQEIETKYTKTKQSLHDINQAYQQLKIKNEQLAKRMERDQGNIDRLPQLQLQLEKMDQMVKESHQKRLAIHELSEFYDQYKDIQDKHYELAQFYTQKEQAYLNVLQTYHQEDENYKCQQAGILAFNLKDNEPCPVCGSLHHPHLATLSTHVFTQKELDDLSQQVEKAKAIKDDAYQEVLILNEQIQNIKTKIDVYKKQLDIHEDLSKEVFIYLLSDITQINQQRKKTYQKQYTEVQYLKRLKHSLLQDQSTYQQQLSTLEQYQKQIHEYEKQLTAYQTQMEGYQVHQSSHDYHKELAFKEKQYEELNQKIQRIDTTYHQLQNKLSVSKQNVQILNKTKQTLEIECQEAKKAFDAFIELSFLSIEEYQKYADMLPMLSQKEKVYQDYQIQQKSLLMQLHQLEQYKDLELMDLSKEEQELKQQEEKKNTLLQKMKEKQLIFQQNQRIIDELKMIYEKNQKIFQDYTMYQDLSDYTSGKNPQKISFERYVLSSYFEHILEYANVELKKMSQGRFVLYRKSESKGNKQQGLDLSVLDYETGMMRDIQSLSGGESFKAALSLALGLSSMIQSYAGGIELNTLFIDEGFGSLDSESLDQALSVLLELKNDHKIIGIISHVRELKERIPTQIVVEKTNDGSTLHIEKE